MPLMKYFGSVGSALVLLLIGISWWFPQKAMGPGGGDAERPVIRISSAEQAPERVVIDTSLPTIVAPSNIGASPSLTAVQSAQPLQSAFAELDVMPNQAAPKSGREIQKPKIAAKGQATKKVANHRAAKPLNIVPASTTETQLTAPDTRTSLLETLRERLGQTFFRLN